jgi:uncharacterized protein (TIGR00369 family)
MTREGPFWDVMEGRAAPPPAATLLGWELVAIDPEGGTIEVAFTASEQFLNPVGAIQGGFLAAMLDDTLGPALVATLGPGLFAPTTDLHVQFLRPARPGRLTGRGRVVRRGREVAFLAGELLDDSGQVVATAMATAQIRAMLPGPGPSGPGQAGGLPAAAVHDLGERPPVGLADRGQRAVGGVAERDEQRPAAVLGETEQLAGQPQVGLHAALLHFAGANGGPGGSPHQLRKNPPACSQAPASGPAGWPSAARMSSPTLASTADRTWSGVASAGDR